MNPFIRSMVSTFGQFMRGFGLELKRELSSIGNRDCSSHTYFIEAGVPFSFAEALCTYYAPS
jgi:hypothetical protein